MSRNKDEAIVAARAVFDQYAAMDAPLLPEGKWSALQVRLARWQNRNFGVPSLPEITLGVCEEAGELAHAVLKNTQRIRGLAAPDEFRAAAGDAIADATIYLMQAATALRLDFESLVAGVAAQVMLRDWKADPQAAGGAA